MLLRFCDRCGLDITATAWSRLDRIPVPFAEGGGTIDRSWELCAGCLAAVTICVESSQARRAIVVSLQTVGEVE